MDNLEFQVENSQDGLRDNLPGALDEIKVKKKRYKVRKKEGRKGKETLINS